MRENGGPGLICLLACNWGIRVSRAPMIRVVSAFLVVKEKARGISHASKYYFKSFSWSLFYLFLN